MLKVLDWLLSNLFFVESPQKPGEQIGLTAEAEKLAAN